MSRPLNLPTWATSGANIVEPAAGKKTTGWLAGEQPPAGYFNWLWNQAGRWLQHFDLQAWVSALLGGTTHVTGAVVPFAAFAASPTRLVGVGEAAGIYTSDDLGRTWTARTNAQGGGYTGSFTRAVYTGTAFVIGGHTGEIQTSPDGETWDVPSSDGGFGASHVTAIAHRAGTDRLVIGGDPALLTRSVDGGLTHAANSPPLSHIDRRIEDIVVADALPFVLCVSGTGITRANMIWRSTNAPTDAVNDGSTWAAVDLTSVLAADESIARLAHHPSLGFVALVQGPAYAKRAILVSLDGVSWARAGEVLALMDHPFYPQLHATSAGLLINNQDASGSVLFSADGEQWDVAPKPGLAKISLVTMNALELALAGTATGTVYVSNPWLR